MMGPADLHHTFYSVQVITMQIQAKAVLIIIAVIPVLLLCTPVDAQGNKQTLGYGYITIDGESATLTIINPNNTTALNALDIPNPVDYHLAEAVASPNGQWLAIAFEQYLVGTRFAMLNVVTREWIEIAQFAHTEQVKLRWASDSNYLVFNGHSLDTQLYGIYIYSLLTHECELLQLEEETEHYHDFPYDFTWAASSDGIVVVSTNCQNQWCEPKFQLYAIPSHELLTSALFNTVTTRVCDLRLAAGMQYLSFVTPCEPDIPATQFYEVFIWDTQSGAFTQVTHYTNELSGLSINAPAFITVYDGIWLTNQEFLLSVFNIERAPDQALPETGLHQTAIYAPPFTSQTLLTYTHATGYEWVKNPLTGDLAYREETYTYSPWPEIDTASVRIATFENHTLLPVYSGPLGCDLKWSSDGRWLGYLNTTSWEFWHNCSNFSGLSFIENSSGQVSSYSFPAAERIVPVGWLMFPYPVSQTGPDQTLTDTDASGSEPVTLDGSASTDPDGTIVSYSWTENDVEIATGITPTVDLPVGEHTITLTVTDDGGLTASDTVVITVQAASTSDRVTANLQALYTFDEGSGLLINDVSGVGAPMDLTIDNQYAVTWAAGG
jgi:hypothetical protein